MRYVLFIIALLWSVVTFAAPMLLGNETSQPIGHQEYCLVNLGECTEVAPTEPLRKADVWKRLVQINVRVNQDVNPVTDWSVCGVDECWRRPYRRANGTLHGDCEDYVLEKRWLLEEAGLSPSTLLITVVKRENGEGHALLTVRTDEGDFVLDNLVDEILPWETSRDRNNYTFLKREASTRGGRWVEILDDPIVASVPPISTPYTAPAPVPRPDARPPAPQKKQARVKKKDPWNLTLKELIRGRLD